MKRVVSVLVGLLLCGVGGYAWLKAPYTHPAAAAVAREFLTQLQAGQLHPAFELTLKEQGLVGRDLAEFQLLVSRQLCSTDDLTLVGQPRPPQSNGNRLRRWLSRQSVEMPSVSFRFEEGPCLITVELRRDGAGRWRVFHFQSHAG